MSNLLIILITLVLRLDILWNKLPERPMDMTKAAAVALVDELDQYYPDSNPFDPEVYFDSISGAPPGWIAATAVQRGFGCTSSMVLNVNLAYETHPFYNTPLWVSTIAHELYHVKQGAACLMPEQTVENAASIASHVALYNAWRDGNSLAYYGLLYSLRREFTLAAADLMLQEDRDPNELFDRMKLTTSERAYFDKAVSNPSKLSNQGNLYWTAFATQLLTDEDGVFSNPAYVEEVDTSELAAWILGLKTNPRIIRHGRYQR